uniref:TATA-box binding protein n=1 Tax=Ditylenchus dipsaci TaxID=166011 RepID=A0A915DQ01_9BILA
MVIAGAKSIKDSYEAALMFVESIKNAGFDAMLQDFKVQNMVGSVDAKIKIDLNTMAKLNRQCCTYEAELFPGLSYRVIQPKVTMLVFASGKVVITGAKTQEHINKAYTLLYPKLLAAALYK